MERWCLLLAALVASTHAKKLPVLNSSAGHHAAKGIQFYLVASRPMKLNLTTCSPATPPTCALSDDEASYVAHRAIHKSGHIHALLNARTVRTEFLLQVATGQLSSVASRQAALDLSAAILGNTTSALLARPLSLHELNLAALAIARNAPRCVQLNGPTVRDMWAGFVYREAQQANFTAADPISQFVVVSVLFLAQSEKPASRPDTLKFSLFARARLAQLVANTCTKVPEMPIISPELVSLAKDRQVIQLVTWYNNTVTVKEVAPSEVVSDVPTAHIADGAMVVKATGGGR